MRRQILGALLTLAVGLGAALGVPVQPADAKLVSNRCDPDRPRRDVYVCGMAWTHRARVGRRRVLDAVRVQSRGDNSELDDCPATTVSITIWRPGTLHIIWSVTNARLCQSNRYSRTFRGMAGRRVGPRAHFQIVYRQHLNFDTDEFGSFSIGVR